MKFLVFLISLIESAPVGNTANNALSTSPRATSLTHIKPLDQMTNDVLPLDSVQNNRLHSGLSVTDSSASGRKDSYFLPFQMNLEVVDNINEIADLHQKLQEIYSLMTTNDPLSWTQALQKSSQFDDYSRKVILNYAFAEHHWYLTRRMLEKGFDPSDILKILNDLPSDVALEKVDKIGYFGIYKDKEGFKYKDINKENEEISGNLVKYYKYRLLRSISSDFVLSEKFLSPAFSKILFETAASKDHQPNLEELSNLDWMHQSIALAYMVVIRKWRIAKEMIARKYDQQILRRLLDQCSDNIAINSYKALGFYPDFDLDTFDSYRHLKDSDDLLDFSLVWKIK